VCNDKKQQNICLKILCLMQTSERKEIYMKGGMSDEQEQPKQQAAKHATAAAKSTTAKPAS
jgi:hypothetical protein